MSEPIAILGLARTPLGGLLGALSAKTAPELGSVAIRAALSQSNIAPEDVDEVIMGCVLPAGLGQAPARQAALGADIPLSAGCTTVNKMCGSGMKAIMLGMDAIRAGSASVVVAGGMESMSNAPYLLPRARQGYRLGHGEVVDHMFLDGLEDAYDRGRLMGTFAEECADKFNFSREAQDAFALESLARANRAIDEKRFVDEIAAVTIAGRGGDSIVDTDEQPGNARPEKIPKLKPAFRNDGTVTPANSSSISDGAAAVVLMSLAEAEKRNLTPAAVIHDHATHAQEPNWFTTAPIGSIEKLMPKTGFDLAEVDLFEINEAFAVVTMAATHELSLDPARVNVNGGACALGHPIGASGARIVVTLVHALKHAKKSRGVASLCIGGGEATALAVSI